MPSAKKEAGEAALPDQILDLFDRDVDRHIEEIIKVDQTDAEVVRDEIEEYVATEPIRRAYARILERFQETPNKPHEGIAVWISGFFGAGKSSFAKILGYVLESRDLGGTSASELFGRQTADPQIQALLKTINQQVPTKSIIFNVATDQAVTDPSEKLTDIVYRVLLRELGYSSDRELAELEIELEGQDRLTEFEETFERIFDGQSWDDLKHLPATARSKASRVLHELEPDTYPAADSWARTPTPVDVTANFVAQRTFELARRRADGRAIVFVVDEVGQYVARSTDKMTDLQGLAEALGRVGRDRARDWKGQTWLIATSQERLSEVVDNLEGKQVELARLRDRFQIEVDLEPSDIREVTAERVLKKKPTVVEGLEKLYQDHKGKLGQATRVTGRLEGGDLDADSFVELYPFLPYQVPLIIDIVSGLRTQAGALRHVGGANRTIIKLAQQVLINERTRLGEAPVGRLVTLDQVYELLETLVTSERRRDVAEIEEEYGEDGLPTRVAKSLALLQFVKTYPRVPENLAAALHPAVGAQPSVHEVEEALEALRGVSKARETEDGWELLSRVGKDWEEERRGIDPLSRQRGDILRATASQLFEDVVGYRHKNIRTFNVLPVVGGQRLARSGDIELHVEFVIDPRALETARDRARQQSNSTEGRNALHWVVPVSEKLLREVDELHRSDEMIRRHELQKPSQEQAQLLTDEKTRRSTHQGRVTTLLRRAFPEGHSYLRGVETEIREFGDELSDAVRGALQDVVPRLYPKFDLAAVPIKADHARSILESDTLSGLPAVYYEGDEGLGLVRRQGGDFVVDTGAQPLTEVLDYIKERRGYGEDASGRALENKFTGFGYGWDPEAVKLLTATLLRATSIELYSGRRYTSHAEPAVREVFAKTNQFRSATFAPRQDEIEFATLAACAEAFEEMYGTRLSVEEGAIAAALQQKMPEEASRAHQVLSRLEAEGLPGAGNVRVLHGKLQDIGQIAAAEAILSFHGQLDEIRDGLERVRKLRDALTADNLATLRKARGCLDRLFPQLRDIEAGDDLKEDVQALAESLESEDFFAHFSSIASRAGKIGDAYREERDRLEAELDEALQGHLDELRNREEWEGLPEASRDEIVAPFRRVQAKLDRESATLPELQSDLKALPALHAEAVARTIEIQQETETDGGEGGSTAGVHRIRASRLAPRGLRADEDVEEFLEALRDACIDALNRGHTVIIE